MENLQKKLWLWLAQVQTANMNAQAYNTANANQPWRFQIEWWIAWWSQWVIGQQKLSTPTSYESNISSVAPLSESIQLNWFSTPASVLTPESTTNMSIADTFSWITKKKNTNIAQSTKQVDTIPPIWGVPTVPVSPTLAINQQQRLANIAKRQGISMGQWIAPVAPTPSSTWLQWAELQAYNQLTPQEQKTFQALATQGIKAQTDYLQQSKANQEYLKSQEELNKQMEQNRDQAEDIQARQQLESTAKQVANLKQNIGYLGSQGQPWVSATKLDAVSNQVALAQKTYDDVVKIDQLNKANRQLGQESHAIQFTRQMTQLQDDLDSKVNKTIQWALNQFNAAELKGKLDTIPEIEAFQQQLYAQLDWDLSSIMDTNIEARKFLIDRYDRLAESQKEQMQATAKAESEYQKNANTLNKEMSNALGYFVNNNWEPLVDQKTGQQVVVPPETTTNYDASTGQMILMTKNRDGTVGVQIKQVGTGKPTSNWTKIGVNADGSDKYGFVDATKNTVTPYVSLTGNIVPVTAGNKTVRLDQVGAKWFESAINQLKTAWIPIVVGEWYRNQTDTIKSMADRYGIPFNASNPAETAWKLRKAGHQVADPWKSNHESGMAIDVYGSSKLDAVTPAQEKILNANGWYSAGIPWDAGHFEYRWNWSIGWEDIKMQALSLTQWLGGTADERQAFADNVIKVAQRDNISLADAKKKLGYKSADDVEFGKARWAEYKTIKADTRDKLSNASTALTLLNSPQTAIGDVASIVWFLKTIDPASVARESEVDSVRNARGVIDSLSNQFAQLKEGTKLTDSQRNQLKDSIQTIVNAGNAKYYEYINDTEKEFRDRWLDPTVYISKTEIDKAKWWKTVQPQSNIAPVDVAWQLKASNWKTYSFY